MLFALVVSNSVVTFCFEMVLVVRDGVRGVASIVKVTSRSSILNSETIDGSDHTVGPIELLSSLFQKKGFNRGPDCFGLLRMYIWDPGGGGGGGTTWPAGGGGGGGGGGPSLPIIGGGGGGGGGGISLPDVDGNSWGGGGGAGDDKESNELSCGNLRGELGELAGGGGGGGSGGGGGGDVSSASVIVGSSTLLPFDTVTFLDGGGGGGLFALNSCSLVRSPTDCLRT